MLDQANEFLWLPFLRKVYYNTELLWLPGRWFNDFSGLAGVCLPITAFIAWHVRSRAGLYAWIALAVMALMRFNTPEFAYLFLRPIHVLAVCLGPILAVFVTRFIGRKALGLCFVALAAVYLQVLVFDVPHIRTLRDADAALVDRVAQLDGALVLVENTPHRDMDADPARTTEPPPVAAHVEQVLGAATRRRIYGGLWDGWQWSPYRIQVLAGGAFKGRAIATVPVEELRDELGKWGIRHLIVWSQATLDYFRSHRELFAERWVSAPWHEFEFLDADTRTVTTTTGTGRLVSFDPLGARIELDGIRAGDNVVVTTNYHPSWTAHVEGHWRRHPPGACEWSARFPRTSGRFVRGDARLPSPRLAERSGPCGAVGRRRDPQPLARGHLIATPVEIGPGTRSDEPNYLPEIAWNPSRLARV